MAPVLIQEIWNAGVMVRTGGHCANCCTPVQQFRSDPLKRNETHDLSKRYETHDPFEQRCQFQIAGSC